MADSKLSALTAAGAYNDADIYYVVQGGVSKKTTWASIKAAMATAIEYPEVANFAALPAAADHNGEIYVCLASQGTGWLLTLKDSGFYYSNGTTWTRLGALPADYFTDSVLYVADETDPTKVLKFELSGITTGTTRTLTIPDASGTIALTTTAPAAHATSHKSGGSDAIKLDELAAPTDVTTLNASTTAHGLSPKATAPASGLLSVLAIGNGETVRSDKAIFDTTNPAALGSVGPGTALVAARRDHVHAMPTAADVSALPTAGGTMSGSITLGENTGVALDPAGSADGKWTGITVTGTAGYTQAFGDLVTLDKDDSRWEAVDISVAAAATGDARGILGMVVSAGTDGNACTILLMGIIRADANFPALTIGAPVYASTSGDIVVAQPTTADYVIRVIGHGMTADELYFNPDNAYITHT